ncbi:MAG: hypothetical protein J5723_07040 [Ruminococcus sp.]|nr:hypothetical protein [Ruminococcus sp.]
MKNYDEMYQSVLSKYDEYLEKKKKRICTIRRTVPVLACFCLTIVLGVGYWNHFKNLTQIPVQPNILEEPTIEIPDTTSAVTTNTTIQTEIKTEPASTTVPIQSSEVEHIASTAATQTETITTVATNVESAIVTEPVTDRPTETQAPASTAPVIQTTMNNEQQTTAPVQTTVEVPSTTVNLNIHEVEFGYEKEDNAGEHQKPSAPQKIAMKCLNFCELGETLTVEVAMADDSLKPIFYDTAPDYEYKIYVCNPLNFKDVEDEKIIVNEQPKGYRQAFSREEASLFDINGEINNYDIYHHETAEIDFSNYEVGDSGCIAFCFWAVYSEDPLHPSYMGSIQYMHFYVGEKGTSISNLSIEDAIEKYQAVTMS